MIFNPVHLRSQMLRTDSSSTKSMLEYFLARTDEPDKAMGNLASWYLKDVIDLLLIGLHKEVAPMLPKIINWLTNAIAQDEDFGMHRNFHRYNLRSSLALAKWLQNGDAAVQDWEAARELALSNLTDNVWPKNKIKTEGLDDYLSVCIQAEQYAAGIAEFEKYHGVKKVSLSGTLAPRTFGYAVCLHHAHQQFTPEALFKAGRKMLQANLEDHPWLGYGQYARAAMWLKNVYWHNNRTLTPLETILKAYNDMPNVIRPSFV